MDMIGKVPGSLEDEHLQITNTIPDVQQVCYTNFLSAPHKSEAYTATAQVLKWDKTH